jgi:hypothetical protein
MSNLAEQKFGAVRGDGVAPAARCVACKEEICAGATICTKCRTPQDWTRYIFGWKDFGSAILALIPLWSGAIALWALAFKEPAAELRVAAPVCEQGRIVLAFVNDGDTPAVLKLPSLKVVRQSQTTASDLELVPEPSAQYPYLLAPKQSTTVALQSKLAGLSHELPSKSKDSHDLCMLTVETAFQGFKGRDGIASTQCQCPPES